MQFAAALSFNQPEHFVEMAKVADRVGWDIFAVSDHVVFPEKIESAYPYIEDGKPYWPLETAWPDPWVTIAAMAAVTERLRFATNVFILPARHPLLVAKSVGTAAVLSGNRVALGIGVGWMREEFELLGEDFTTRGRRTNEAIEVLRTLWQGGMVEHHGKYYDFDRLTMQPVPTAPVPIWVGGASEAALKRAARLGDGWISVVHDTDELARLIGRLGELRAEYGRADEPFHVMAAVNDAGDLDAFRRLEEIGVTSLVSAPWVVYEGDPTSLDHKLDSIKRYADEIIGPMRG